MVLHKQHIKSQAVPRSQLQNKMPPGWRAWIAKIYFVNDRNETFLELGNFDLLFELDIKSHH